MALRQAALEGYRVVLLAAKTTGWPDLAGLCPAPAPEHQALNSYSAHCIDLSGIRNGMTASLNVSQLTVPRICNKGLKSCRVLMIRLNCMFEILKAQDIGNTPKGTVEAAVGAWRC